MATRVPELAHEALSTLYGHRLVTTNQLHEILAPDRSLRWVQQVLADLLGRGLVGQAPVASRRVWAWYLTPAGVAATEGGGVVVRPYRMTPEQARGPLQAHTLMTNEVGLTFLRSARQRGDDLGGWAHEVPHPLGPGRRSERLISDAVLEYGVVESHTYVVRFIEVDRSTKRLLDQLAKLESYRRLADYRPGWAQYPALPRLLYVTTGRDQPALRRRIEGLRELAVRSPQLGGHRSLSAFATTLDDLRTHGPFGRIWTPLLETGDPVDLLGR